MAYQNNHKRYQVDIGFNVDPKGIKLLQQELKKLEFLKDSDYSKMFGSTSEKYKEEAKKMRIYASEVRMALQAAYNPKLKTVNIETFNRIIKQSGLNLSELSKYFSNVGVIGQNVSALLTNSMTKFNVKIKESHKLLDKMGKTLTNTLKWNLSATLINNVSGSIQQAWGFTKNLQQSLTNIRMVTGKNADEMKRFAQEANKAASQLGRTTTDYTKASLIYAQQGLSDAEIKKRSEITLKTANVTGQSTEAVSEELTAVWNGYKVNAAEAEIYVDRLAAVASTTASSLSELSTGMSKVASAAASLGVGEEQLAAQLSTIISVTRQAPETVGTALKTIYSRISDIQAGIDEDGTTLGTYSGKLAELGIKVLDASGKLRNMGQVMEEIGSKWGTFSKEQQTYIAQTMAGQRQYTNLIALFDNYQDKYISALKTAQGAEGTLNKQNKAYMEDINTKINQMTAATEKMWMNLINTDGFKGVIDDLTKVINKVDQLFQSIGGGKAVLNSIGVIATQLMSKTMASGINTFINNRVQSKEQKASLKQAQIDIQDKIAVLEAQGKGDSAEAKTLRDKARFLPNMQYFSNQSISKINQLWDQSTNAGIQADIAKKQKEEKFDPLKKLAGIKEVEESNLQGIQANIEAANKVFKTDQDAATQIIENSVSNIFQVQTEEIKTATAAVNKAEEIYKDATAKAEEAKEKLQNYTDKKNERDAAKKTYEDLDKKNQAIKANNKNKRKKLKQDIDNKEKQIQEKVAELDDMIVYEGGGYRLKENVTDQGYADLQKEIQTLKQEKNKLLDQLNNLPKPIKSEVNKANKAFQKAQAAFEEERTNNRTPKADVTKAENKVEEERQNVNQAERERIKAIGASRLKAFNNSFSGTIKDKEGKEQQYDLMKYIKAGQQQGASDELKEFAQQYKQLTKEIEESGNASAEEIEELDERVKSFFNALNQYAKQSAGNLETEGQNAMEALQKQKQALKKAKQAAEEAKSGMRQATIQGILQLTGALGQLNMTIQNFANIGSIWDNEDLTETEKFEQTISNLLITIPMLITGYASLSSALGKFSEVKAKHKTLEEKEQVVKEKNIAIQNLENVQQGTNTVIEGANAGAKKAGAKASNKNANAKRRETKEIEKQNAEISKNTLLSWTNIKQGLLNSFKSIKSGIKSLWTSMKNTFGTGGGAALGVLAVAAVTTKVITDMNDKRAQKTVEANKKIIASEKEKQETIKKERDIIAEVEALNKAYKQGNITKTELKQKTLQLQQKYKQESADIQQLIADYHNLGEAAIEAKKKEAQKAVESTKRERKAADVALNKKLQTMRVGTSFANWTGAVSGGIAGQATIGVGAGGNEGTSAKRLTRILGDNLAYYDFWQNTVKLKKGDSQTSFQQLEAMQRYVDTASQAEQKTDVYAGVVQILTEMEEEIKQHKQARVKEKQDYANQQFLKQDYKNRFNNVNNLTEFLQEQKQLFYSVRTTQAQNGYTGLSDSEINELVDKVITQNVSKEIQDKYLDKVEFYNNLNYEWQTSGVSDLLNDMTQEQLAYLKSIDPTSYVSSYKNIFELLKDTSELDFSQMNASAKEAATSAQKWEDYAQKTEKGQKISSDDMSKMQQAYNENNEGKTATGLSWEDFRKKYFYQDEYGNFYATNINDTSNVLRGIKSINYNRNVNNLQQQKNLKESWDKQPVNDLGEFTNLSNNNSFDDQTTMLNKILNQLDQLDLNEADKQTLKSLKTEAGSIKNGDFEQLRVIFDKTQAFKDKIQSQVNNIDSDINQRLEESISKTYRIYNSIDSDINSTHLNLFTNEISKASIKSEIFSENLQSNREDAESAAESIDRYNIGLEKIINNYSDWNTKLSSNNLNEIATILPDIKDAYGDLFNINGTFISDDFALSTENLSLFYDVMMGVEGSYQRLSAKIKTSLIESFDVSNEVEIKLNKLQDIVDLTTIEIGAEIDDKNLINQIETILANTEITEKQMMAYLELLGMKATIINGKVYQITKSADQTTKQLYRSQSVLDSIAQKQRDIINNHKELNKYLEDERDLYHDINREIAKMDRTLSRLETTQQGLTGVELYNNLTQQNAALNEKSNKLKTKSSLQEQDLAQSRTELSSKYGVTFSSDGEISNYLDILASYENQVNAATAKKNSIINSMNAWTDNGGSTSESYYLDLQAALTQAENDYNHINDKYSSLKSDLSAYDSLLDQHEDTIDEQTQTLRKQIAINIQKFDLKVSLQLDLTEAKKNWEEFKKNVLNRDDVLNPNTMGSKEKDVNQAKVNYGDRMKDAQKITSSIDQVLTEIDNFNRAEANGETYQSNLFNSVSQAYTKLTELQEKGEQALEDAAKYADIIKQAYLDAFSYVQEEFDKQNNYYSFISQQLSHDVSLMDLIYGSRGGRYKDNYYNQMNSFGLDQIDMLRQQQQFWAEQEAAATDEAAKKIAHENWENVTQSLNSTTEQAIQNLKSQFENMIDTIVNELENSLTNGHGFDYITLEWDILKGHADMYLDTVNSAFAIKNTKYLFNKAISYTSELRTQQALKRVMQQQMQILKEKDKLTQYDVDRAEKVLEIEKARISLEEARNNKARMRLKRDASGNYSYQFTADEETIDQAQNNLNKAQNDLYNFDLQAWRSNNENAVAVFKDAMSQIAEIRKNDSLNEQQKQERIALVQKDAQEKMTFYAQENNSIRTNLEQSTYDNMIDLMGNSEINYGDMIQGMNSESQNFIDKFNSNPDSVMNMFNEAIQNMQDKATEYDEKIANVVEAAGLNFGNLKSAIDPVVQNEAAMVTNNDALISSMDSTIAKATEWKTTLGNIESWWKGVYDQTSDALTKAQEYLTFKLTNDLNDIQNNPPEDPPNKKGGGKDPLLKNLFKNPGTPGNEGGYSKLPKSSTDDEDISETNDYSKIFGAMKNNFTSWLGRKGISDNFNSLFTQKNPSLTARQSAILLAYLADKSESSKVGKKINGQGRLSASDFKSFFKTNFGITPSDDFVNTYYTNLLSDTNPLLFKTIVDNKYSKAWDSWNYYTSLDDPAACYLTKKDIEKHLSILKFDTGGYTGDWSSSDGKLAVLHEKELVLNKDDTENMLKMLEFSRTMSELVQDNVLATLNSQKQYLNSIQQQMSNTTKTYQQKILEKQKMAAQALEQQVKIEANFPSVTSHKEIEQAFSNLVNLATQKALKYNKN